MSILWNKPAFLVLAVIIGAAGILLKAPLALLLATLLVIFALQKLPDAPAVAAAELRFLLPYALMLVGLAGAVLAAWLAAGHQFHFDGRDVAIWLASVVAVTAGAIWHDSMRHLHSPAAPRSRSAVLLEVGFVTLLTVLAVGLRVYDLVGLPPAVHGDEGEVGMLALRVLENKEPLPIFTSTIFGRNPAGFPYLIAPLIAAFGRNEVGLRLLPALMGALSVPFLYLIGRRGWGVLAGASAAWLLAVSHFHIHYSRIAVPNIGNAFWMVLLVWVIVRAWQRNLPFFDQPQTPNDGEPAPSPARRTFLRTDAPLADFAGIGLVIGFGQYIYHGGRLLPILAAVAFAIMLFKRKVTLLQLAAAGLAALVVVLPLATFYASNLLELTGRSEDVFIFSETNLRNAMGADATFATHLLPYLNRQFVTTLGFITGDGDRSSFYLADVGIFDPVTLVLIWLGLGALLTRIRRYEESVVAAWFFLTMLFAGFLTTEQPNGPRLISVAPACYLLGGIFIARAAALLPGLARGRSRAMATVALGGLGLFVLYLNWRIYFVELKTYSHSILPTAVARAVAAAPPTATVYIMGDPILYAGHGAIRFLARTENIYDLKSPADLPDPETYERGTWVLALEPSRAALQTIAEQHPGGERQAVTDEHDRFLYETYYLP